MYNRYIPQADGTFHRHPIPDTQKPYRASAPPSKPEPGNEEACHSPQTSPIPHAGSRCKHCPMRQRRGSQAPCGNSGISSFFSQLLPDDFDTGDLMVILLLLLMSGDHSEDQSTALLTLALYLFL